MARRMVWRKAGLAKLKELGDGVAEAISVEVQRDAKRLCPVDTGELRSTIRRFKAGDTWFVTVGTDYWSYVEYPTKPHIIRSHGPWPLRNPRTGQVFGPVVRHPGTAAQPFMRPAIYRTRSA